MAYHRLQPARHVFLRELAGHHLEAGTRLTLVGRLASRDADEKVVHVDDGSRDAAAVTISIHTLGLVDLKQSAWYAFTVDVESEVGALRKSTVATMRAPSTSPWGPCESQEPRLVAALIQPFSGATYAQYCAVIEHRRKLLQEQSCLKRPAQQPTAAATAEPARPCTAPGTEG